jgi:hypothetical protein
MCTAIPIPVYFSFAHMLTLHFRFPFTQGLPNAPEFKLPVVGPTKTPTSEPTLLVPTPLPTANPTPEFTHPLEEFGVVEIPDIYIEGDAGAQAAGVDDGVGAEGMPLYVLTEAQSEVFSNAFNTLDTDHNALLSNAELVKEFGKADVGDRDDLNIAEFIGWRQATIVPASLDNNGVHAYQESLYADAPAPAPAPAAAPAPGVPALGGLEESSDEESSDSVDYDELDSGSETGDDGIDR